VQGPYVAIGVAVCLLAVLIARTPFPSLERRLSERSDRRPLWTVLRHRRLTAAVVTQFFYVGAQVGVWSFFIDFAKSQAPQLVERNVAFLLSGSLAMLMIGRFSGAFLQRRVAPARLLAIYGFINVALCAAAASLGGELAVGALWLTSFFMSIMFPTIFALGLEGLGEETESGASFLIMSIIGGALVPPVMGVLSDRLGGIHHMMVIPMLCFMIVAAFAVWTSREARR